MSESTITAAGITTQTDGDGKVTAISAPATEETEGGVFSVVETAASAAYDFVATNGTQIAGGLIGGAISKKLGGGNAAAAIGVAGGALLAESAVDLGKSVFAYFNSDGDEVEGSDIHPAINDATMNEHKQKDINPKVNAARPNDALLVAEQNNMSMARSPIAQTLDNANAFNATEDLVSNLIANGAIKQKTDEFVVKLTSQQTGERVLFNVTPNVDESRSATYDSISPLHFPGSIQVYKTTNARAININGKFIARTTQEASRTLEFMNLIRSWVMPYFGEGTAEDDFTADRLGAPPDVLVLTAYGKKNLRNVPVVLSSYSWTYPDDVDYIPSEWGEACPKIIDVSLTLMETYSPKEYGEFNLKEYKLGFLDEAYNSSFNRPRKWASANGTPRNRDFGRDSRPSQSWASKMARTWRDDGRD